MIFILRRLPLLQGLNPCSANALNVSLSSLKSILVPTSIIGASGQWCFNSGYHFDVTFSNEEGLCDEQNENEHTMWWEREKLYQMCRKRFLLSGAKRKEEDENNREEERKY